EPKSFSPSWSWAPNWSKNEETVPNQFAMGHFFFLSFVYLQVLKTLKGSKQESHNLQTQQKSIQLRNVKIWHRNNTVVHRGASISVDITGIAIMNASVELVTTNGLPFYLMDDFGFRKIIDPALNGLNGSSTDASHLDEFKGVVAFSD
ncbi:unnamed protein product, partial [Ixodes pacificus]